MTKKMLVFSDSHGVSEYMNKAMELHPDADLTVHLGDGACDLTMQLPEDCAKPLVLIEGNGEYYGTVTIDRRYRPKNFVVTEFEGKSIFMTHGHLYDVKYSLSRIIARAYSEGADIILFGHTHIPICKYFPEGSELAYVGRSDRPLILFNPGSIGRGTRHTFGLLTFSNGQVLASHGEIK